MYKVAIFTELYGRINLIAGSLGNHWYHSTPQNTIHHWPIPQTLSSSEHILLGTYSCHGTDGISHSPCMSLNATLTHSHEWVEGKFLSNRWWNSRFSTVGLCLGPCQLVCHCSAVRLHCGSELEVLDGVLVATVDLSWRRQYSKNVDQCSVHVSCRSLEETTASRDEQRITSEHHTRLTIWSQQQRVNANFMFSFGATFTFSLLTSNCSTSYSRQD